SDVSLVCVGTPSNGNGSLKLDYIKRSSEQIGEAIARKPSRDTVVMRSTMLPGTIANVVKPALESSSKKKDGDGFDVCINPEFLREGTSIKDFYAPPFTLIGTNSVHAEYALRDLCSSIDAPVF